MRLLVDINPKRGATRNAIAQPRRPRPQISIDVVAKPLRLTIRQSASYPDADLPLIQDYEIVARHAVRMIRHVGTSP